MNEPMAHPRDALFAGEKPFPTIPACEHIAGSEKLILKSFELQEQLGPIFDLTCDCEDGARAGQEIEHAKTVARLIAGPANRLRMAGARIHDSTQEPWRREVEILLSEAGHCIAYITLPKVSSADHARVMIDFIRETSERLRLPREIPIHEIGRAHV